MNKGIDETSCTVSPQAEDGHIDIAHEIAEAFYMLQLSGNQWRLLWVILRQSYGWKKKEDRISFSFFQSQTGLDRRNIGRELKELVSRHIIVKNDNGYIVSYGLQKDYMKWILKPLSKMAIVNNDNKVLSKLTTTKETIQKKIVSPEKIIAEISDRLKRYPDQETVKQAFSAIQSTRKSNRIADSVKLSILKAWERYPVESVMAGIRTYLDRGYANQGKDEKYLLGIIRNSGNGDHRESEINGGQVMKSTGSHALDDHYRSQGIRII